MERIKLHDKYFKLYIPNETIEAAIIKVAHRLNEDYKDVDTPIFLGMLNGAFMFTATVLKNINFLCELSFVKYCSYAGLSSSGDVKQLLGLDRDIRGRHIIITEDVVDTGLTIHEMYRLLKDAGAADVQVATMFHKPGAYKYADEIEIKYPAMESRNEFIIGYGLDYDQLGRQFKDIYIIDE